MGTVGLAFGVVSGDSTGEDNIICGTCDIAGADGVDRDEDAADTGNGKPCRRSGSCIEAGDTAGVLLPKPRDPAPPPPPLFLPPELTPKLAHKKAHIRPANEFDCCVGIEVGGV